MPKFPEKVIVAFSLTFDTRVVIELWEGHTKEFLESRPKIAQKVLKCTKLCRDAIGLRDFKLQG